jgi:hypothetical protein
MLAFDSLGNLYKESSPGTLSLIAAADQREQQRAVALQSSLEQTAALKRRVQTPEQILRELPKFLPLPAPIRLVRTHPVQQRTGPNREKGTAFPEPSPQSANATQATDPPPDFAAQLPAEGLEPLFDFVQDCRICQTQLAAARSDLIDERAKAAFFSKERDAAIKAAKGGSVWARFKHKPIKT